MVKCLTRGLRGFNGAVQRRLWTLTITMLISACWQLSSEVELQRIFDVCKRRANSGLHEILKKNMVRYMRPHGRFAHCSCSTHPRPRPVSLGRGFMLHFHTCSAQIARFGLLYRNILIYNRYSGRKALSVAPSLLTKTNCYVTAFYSKINQINIAHF